MTNMLMQMLMSQLQAKNPQAFQIINNAKNSGTNPQEFMKQMMNGVSPEQMQNVLTQAKNMGVPDEVLKQVQNINK